jgi:hypothetical protein
VPSDDGRHAWIFKVACEYTEIYRRFLARAIDCERIEPEQDEKFIRDELTRPEQRGEIRHAVQNAYDYQYRKKGVQPDQAREKSSSIPNSSASSRHACPCRLRQNTSPRCRPFASSALLRTLRSVSESTEGYIPAGVNNDSIEADLRSRGSDVSPAVTLTAPPV